MGYEMYAFVTPCIPDRAVDFPFGFACEEPERIFYWRNNHRLLCWMTKLYLKKGGSDLVFNLKQLRLTTEDIDELYQHILERLFLPGRGYRLDKADMDAIAYDLEFVERARQALAADLTLILIAWQ